MMAARAAGSQTRAKLRFIATVLVLLAFAKGTLPRRGRVSQPGFVEPDVVLGGCFGGLQRRPPMERWRSQTNLLNAMFGLLLFVSPWLLGFSGMGAWNAWISGAVLIAVSMTAITYFAEWEEWVDL